MIFSHKSKVIIITGMHRSGTSLTASLLQSMGVNIGERLMGSGNGNNKGHFEDLDFVEFHQDILYSQGLNKDGWIYQSKIEVQEQFVSRAKNIINSRRVKPIWGWKDPRTTLFLEFWSELIPEANFLFIFRPPWEVIDSLYRRGDSIFHNNPDFAIKTWMNYNRAILSFYEKFSDRSILINLKDISNNQKLLYDSLEKKFNIPLSSSNLNSYDNSLLSREDYNSQRSSFLKHYFPDAIDLFFQLERLNDNNRNNLNLTRFSIYKIPDFSVWALQDWQRIRYLERKIDLLQEELNRSKQNYENSRLWKMRNRWIKLKKLFSSQNINTIE